MTTITSLLQMAAELNEAELKHRKLFAGALIPQDTEDRQSILNAITLKTEFIFPAHMRPYFTDRYGYDLPSYIEFAHGIDELVIKERADTFPKLTYQPPTEPGLWAARAITSYNVSKLPCP